MPRQIKLLVVLPNAVTVRDELLMARWIDIQTVLFNEFRDFGHLNPPSEKRIDHIRRGFDKRTRFFGQKKSCQMKKNRCRKTN